MRSCNLLLTCLILVFGSPLLTAAADDEIKLIGVQKIWDQAPHNAFTSLIRFQDQWLCAFREASAHAGKNVEGKMRLVSSKDAEHWQSAALLADERGDIRDAKLSITPSGELMLLTATALRRGEAKGHQSIAFFTKDLKTWEGPVDVGEPNVWLWGICWHKGTGYSIGYGTGPGHFVRLYKTTDGRHFAKVVDRFEISAPFPNENAMAIDAQDKATVLLRCDPDNAFVGTAAPPYTEWTWKQTNARVGGPALMQTESGRLLGGGRLYDGKVRTGLFWVDPEKATIGECLTLPSAGDTSYPGLVFHDGVLYVSYYSSHETKTSIYLARCQLPSAQANAQRLNAILADGLAKRGSFISVHAAEDLIALGQRDTVRNAFASQADTAPAPYRIGVWRVLARSMSDDAQRALFVERIRGALMDPKGTDRVHAMEALAKLEAPIKDAAERAEVEHIARSSDASAPFAWWRLAQAGDAQAIPALVKLVSSPDEVTQARAADALARLNVQSDEARQALRAALASASASSLARPLLIVALGGEPVRQLLNDPSAPARYQAAMYLSRHGTPADVAALQKQIDDDDLDVRSAAAFALSRIESQRASTAAAFKETGR